ncbi:MAG: hypothetical protein WD715_10070 [Dongiaceae bacterium]
MAPAHRFLIILAMPRSGTHFLRSALSKGAEIVNLDEPFNPDLTRKLQFSFGRFLRNRVRREADWRHDAATAEIALGTFFGKMAEHAPDKRLLVDIKDEQLRIADWPPTPVAGPPRLLSFIIRNKFPIVRMTRRDLLAQYASYELATQSGRWVSNQEPGQHQREISALRIEPDKAIRHMEGVAADDAAVEQWLSGYPQMLRLTYEEMIVGGRLSDTARRGIERLTGLSISGDVVPEPEKMAPQLRDLVTNLDEVLDTLSNTSLSHFPEQYGRP